MLTQEVDARSLVSDLKWSDQQDYEQHGQWTMKKRRIYKDKDQAKNSTSVKGKNFTFIPIKKAWAAINIYKLGSHALYNQQTGLK